MEPGPRSRAETKQETRDALIAAALAEFASHGLDAPSLDAICARAGYTRGAFYVHFRDRADLMVAVVERAMGAFLDTIIAQGDEAHDLERTIGRFTDAIASTLAIPGRSLPPIVPLPANVPFARVLEAVSREPRLRDRFRALLAGAVARMSEVTIAGQQAGAVRRDVDGVQVGAILTLLALGILTALDTGLTLDPAATHATVLGLLAPTSGGAPRKAASKGRKRARARR